MKRRSLLATPLLLAATTRNVMPPPQRDSEALDEAAIPPETLAVLRGAEAHLRARLEPRFGQARLRFERDWDGLPMTREGALAGLFPLAGWWRDDRVLCVFGRANEAVVPYIVLTNLRDG